LAGDEAQGVASRDKPYDETMLRAAVLQTTIACAGAA